MNKFSVVFTWIFCLFLCFPVTTLGDEDDDEHKTSLVYELHLCWNNTEVPDIERFFTGDMTYAELPSDNHQACELKYPKLADQLFWIKVTDYTGGKHYVMSKTKSETEASDDEADNDESYQDEDSEESDASRHEEDSEEPKVSAYPFGTLANLVNACNGMSEKCPYKGDMRETWHLLQTRYETLVETGNQAARKFANNKRMMARFQSFAKDNTPSSNDEEEE